MIEVFKEYLRGARGFAIFLAVIGLIWVGFTLGEKLKSDRNIFTPPVIITVCIFIFWIGRSLGLGPRRVWLVCWAVSFFWHATGCIVTSISIFYALAFGLFSSAAYRFLGTAALALIAVVSGAGFYFDLKRKRSEGNADIQYFKNGRI